MPPFGPTSQPQHDLKITAEDRDLLWRLLRESGSKTMPDDMNAFVSGIQIALGRYRQSKEEDHRRRSAREDLRDLFMACGDDKNAPKIRRKFPRLPVLAREELLRRAKARHPDLNGGAVDNIVGHMARDRREGEVQRAWIIGHHRRAGLDHHVKACQGHFR